MGNASDRTANRSERRSVALQRACFSIGGCDDRNHSRRHCRSSPVLAGSRDLLPRLFAESVISGLLSCVKEKRRIVGKIPTHLRRPCPSPRRSGAMLWSKVLAFCFFPIQPRIRRKRETALEHAMLNWTHQGLNDLRLARRVLDFHALVPSVRHGLARDFQGRRTGHCANSERQRS